MFANQHTNNPTAKRYREAERQRLRRSTLGAAARIEAAQAKRDRKNAKRAQIANRTVIAEPGKAGLAMAKLMNPGSNVEFVQRTAPSHAA